MIARALVYSVIVTGLACSSALAQPLAPQMPPPGTAETAIGAQPPDPVPLVPQQPAPPPPAQTVPQVSGPFVTETDAALPDPQVVLPNLVRASRLARNMVTGLDGDGAEVLENFQTLLQNAHWVGPKLAEAGAPVREAGVNINRVWHGMMHTVAWNNPENMQLFQKFLDRIQKLLDDRGGDLKVISEALLPQFSGIGGALMNFDTSQILSNALAGTPEEGAIRLHVAIPDR